MPLISHQEKLEADIALFETSRDLHEAFIVRINLWIREYRSRAIDLFRKFDADGDGTLSYDEFHAGMRDLNAPCSTLELHVLTKLLDTDHNGQLDYHEFAKGVKYYKPEETVPDDGLPVLRISRKNLEHCQHCQLKLWKPNEVKFPRFDFPHNLFKNSMHLERTYIIEPRSALRILEEAAKFR